MNEVNYWQIPCQILLTVIQDKGLEHENRLCRSMRVIHSIHSRRKYIIYIPDENKGYTVWTRNTGYAFLTSNTFLTFRTVIQHEHSKRVTQYRHFGQSHIFAAMDSHTTQTF